MTFSRRLQQWLHSDQPKTILGLDQIVAEKSFAIIFLILLSPAALPIPTGGATHLFGVLSILLSLELMIGRHTLWIPKRWRNHHLGRVMQTKTLPALIKVIRFCEKFSRPRFSHLLRQPLFLRLCGLLIAVCALGTVTAIPFSGLDTLPAMGGALISLGLILEDVVFLAAGSLVGIAGIGLQIALGKATVAYLTRIF